MSRTIRRKGFNYKGNRNSFAHEREKDVKNRNKVADFYFGSLGKPSKYWFTEKEAACQESAYHRDNHSGRRCVPGLYCTLKYHRPMRVHVRMDIQKSILLDDWDNAIIGKRMDSNKSLGWMWF